MKMSKIRINICFAMTLLTSLMFVLIAFTDIETDVLIALSGVAIGSIATVLKELADPDEHDSPKKSCSCKSD